MPPLSIRFAKNLSNDLRLPGPVFHRWLPTEADPLELLLPEQGARLRFWFRRRGYVEEGLLVYKEDRDEFDETIMPLQALLQAGVLRGQLDFDDIGNETLAALERGGFDDPAYMRLGKLGIRLILPQMGRVVQILRTTFGQYWLEPIQTWDSRCESLGHVCYFMGMRWSQDGAHWRDFVPNEPQSFSPWTHEQDLYRQYPMEEDWRWLQSAFSAGYSPPLAIVTLSRSHELNDQGKTSLAVLEAITALEIAVDDALRSQIGGDPAVKDIVQAVWGLPFSARFTLAATSARVPHQDLLLALKVYALRNQIAHEGADPGTDIEEPLRGLGRVISVLSGVPRLRFPRVGGQLLNEIRKTPESWMEQPAPAIKFDSSVSAVVKIEDSGPDRADQPRDDAG